MTLRTAQVADGEAVANIWNGAIRGTTLTFNSVVKREEEVAALIAERAAAGHPVLVVEEGGRVCGFAFYLQFRAGPGYRHTMEHTIHLSPEARGQGLGRLLLIAVERQAARGGVHLMVAGISGENHRGRAFHRALGYTEIGIVPEAGRKFGRWLDLHLLCKRLDGEGGREEPLR